ncbi:IS3 family transposase [Arcanobacterium phocae]|uniref:IS3 family transposase n=1 Tax=Arcanobacterium phocae TaxID=131112 RepID=UPI00344D86D8
MSIGSVSLLSSSERRYTLTVLVVCGYSQSKSRGVSARSLRDAALIEHIVEVHESNYNVYGIRKMWHALRREGKRYWS